ncbi:MAG: ribose-phosphate pyrophosphokinase [candidate division KSB1 bacterium]|nr:ribose-phosphate pyrophosphokinase [candidate division KSB1 bacterium]
MQNSGDGVVPLNTNLLQQRHPKIFTGRSNPALARKIADYLDMELGDNDIRDFSDGEIWVKYNENIRGADVFLIQSTNSPPRNLMELLIMIDAARRASAMRVTAVIPYFGYARQDRKDQPRVAITAKLVANLLTTSGADRVLTMDMHAPQIQGFFDIPLDHLYAVTIFTDYFRKKELDDFVVVSPDIGGIRRARSYAKRLNAPIAMIDKRRPRQNVAEVLHVIGDVKGRNVIMVDDICDTAGTLAAAANFLKEKGAREIYAGCTHAILSGNAVEKIQNSAVTELVVTDTVHLPPEKKIDKIKVLSVAELFGRAIMRIHNEESISSLFDTTD